jgi:hypothetical protein
MNYASYIAAALEKEIGHVPPRFYDSFDYTSTGNNLTHPITVALLSKILWQIPGVEFVAEDLRLNMEKTKFQPDLTALKTVAPLSPLLFVDYESPNSCDTRIPDKDVGAYLEWSTVKGERTPYVIITTLPKRPSEWELRWASKGDNNAMYKGRRNEISRNPFKFWYAHYRKALAGKDLRGLSFVNIDDKKVEVVSV